eukprot:351839-Chlamydomonas_euryale.AAC.4
MSLLPSLSLLAANADYEVQYFMLGYVHRWLYRWLAVSCRGAAVVVPPPHPFACPPTSFPGPLKVFDNEVAIALALRQVAAGLGLNKRWAEVFRRPAFRHGEAHRTTSVARRPGGGGRGGPRVLVPLSGLTTTDRTARLLDPRCGGRLIDQRVTVDVVEGCGRAGRPTSCQAGATSATHTRCPAARHGELRANWSSERLYITFQTRRIRHGILFWGGGAEDPGGENHGDHLYAHQRVQISGGNLASQHRASGAAAGGAHVHRGARPNGSVYACRAVMCAHTTWRACGAEGRPDAPHRDNSPMEALPCPTRFPPPLRLPSPELARQPRGAVTSWLLRLLHRAVRDGEPNVRWHDDSSACSVESPQNKGEWHACTHACMQAGKGYEGACIWAACHTPRCAADGEPYVKRRDRPRGQPLTCFIELFELRGCVRQMHAEGGGTRAGACRTLSPCRAGWAGVEGEGVWAMWAERSGGQVVRVGRW